MAWRKAICLGSRFYVYGEKTWLMFCFWFFWKTHLPSNTSLLFNVFLRQEQGRGWEKSQLWAVAKWDKEVRGNKVHSKDCRENTSWDSKGWFSRLSSLTFVCVCLEAFWIPVQQTVIQDQNPSTRQFIHDDSSCSSSFLQNFFDLRLWSENPSSSFLYTSFFLFMIPVHLPSS